MKAKITKIHKCVLCNHQAGNQEITRRGGRYECFSRKACNARKKNLVIEDSAFAGGLVGGISGAFLAGSMLGSLAGSISRISRDQNTRVTLDKPKSLAHGLQEILDISSRHRHDKM